MAALVTTTPPGVTATGYPKLPNRRTALATLAGVGAALSLPKATRAATAHVSADPHVDALWRNLLLTRGAMNAADAAVGRAEDTMPWWAQVGPSHVNHKGEFVGLPSASPAMTDYKLPSEGCMRMIRLPLFEIDRLYSHLGSSKGTQQAREASVALLNERLAAQQIEVERAGLPLLRDAHHKAYRAWSDAEAAIADLTSPSFDATAARIISTTISETSPDNCAENDGIINMATVALGAFLPFLTGELATDAAEFVNNPTREVGAMRASQGINADGSRVLA